MKVIAAYDNDSRCVDTYNRNLEPVARLADLENWRALDIPECDGIIASPPCQDASHANLVRVRDRNNLFVTTARIIATKQPQWALIENVPTMKGKTVFGSACRILTDAGYWISTTKLNHADFGGYTTRERLFMIATRQLLPSPEGTKKWAAHGDLIKRHIISMEPVDTENYWPTDYVARFKDVVGNISIRGRQRNSAIIYRRFNQPWFSLVDWGSVARVDGQYYRWHTTLSAQIQGFPSWYEGLTNRTIINAIPPELTRPWGQILSRAYGPDQSVVSLFCGAGGGDYGLLEGGA